MKMVVEMKKVMIILIDIVVKKKRMGIVVGQVKVMIMGLVIGLSIKMVINIVY